ncbi:SH3 domain-containing protein [Psychrobacter sp. PAMC 21119]|uniref:SH3 domain-containing protein n=1 Tax=Psychrobacter sp. PAMC 21119 TaxID=1112209 RepID=UPI0002883706|nr:SH3 domain-containing protein [Psychrobacter sp. PAMC 21119]
MDEEPRKEYKLPSMLEMFDKVQSQMNPLSYQLEKLNSIQEIANQYEHLNPAVNIARKAVQPVDLASSSVVDHIAVAMNAQLRVPEAMAVQDNFLEMKKGMGAYNNSLMSVRESLIQSTGGTSVYENMMSSVNLIRDSLEPYRSTFDAVRTSFEASESFKLVRELQAQVALANSFSSEYSSLFEQFDSLRNFESFQSIFRLNDVQFEEVISTNLTQEDITNFSSKPISEIDSDLSDEIESGKDFSLYSEKAKKILHFICTVILLQYIIGMASSVSVNYIQQFQEESKNLETSREIKSFIRSPLPLVDRRALKGHRVTTVNTLNFRDNLGKNSTIVDTIPIGTIVRVMDKSDKSWLLVEVEIDGELEQGWVLRRYTTYFK